MRRRPSTPPPTAPPLPPPLFPLRGKSIAMKWLHTRRNGSTFAASLLEHTAGRCAPACTPLLQIVVE